MIKKGDRVKYLIRLNIAEDFPPISIVIRLVLRNQVSKNVIISFDLPVSIERGDS